MGKMLTDNLEYDADFSIFLTYRVKLICTIEQTFEVSRIGFGIDIGTRES